MKRELALLLLFVAVAVALPACGGDEGGDQPVTPAAAVPAGEGLTVSEALRSDLDDVLLVRGFLVVVDGRARLCETLAESYPPQCREASVAVRGLRLEDFQLQSAGGSQWTDGGVTLTGRLEDGAFVVDPTALGTGG